MWRRLRTHFAFHKTMRKCAIFFYHFRPNLLEICQNFEVIIIFSNKIKVYNLILNIHTCSRWHICIIMRFKQLLNFRANIERKCTVFYFNSGCNNRLLFIRRQPAITITKDTGPLYGYMTIFASPQKSLNFCLIAMKFTI